MRKLQTAKAARLVKQQSGEWYIVWYDQQNPPQRFRQKFNLNRIKDLTLRDKWATAILDFINDKTLKGANVSVSDVDSHFQPSSERLPNAPLVTFLGHVQRFIDLRDGVLEHGTVKVFRTTLNNLNGYALAKLKKPSLDWTDFDIDFPLRFQAWCYAAPRKHSKNYVSKLFDVIRQFLRDAAEHDLDVGKAWKSPKYVIPKTQVDEVALSVEEVEKMYQLDLEGTLREVRDLFVVSCLTGLRYSDVTRVNDTHIINLKKGVKSFRAVKIDTKKTGEKVIVPLHPFAVEILERNRGTILKPPCNQIFNRSLKEIAKLAGLTEGVSLRINVGGKQKTETKAKYHCVTTHTGRRTFATVAYMTYKMPVGLIMKLTGHRTEKEFFKYIKISQEMAAIEMYEYMVK